MELCGEVVDLGEEAVLGGTQALALHLVGELLDPRARQGRLHEQLRHKAIRTWRIHARVVEDGHLRLEAVHELLLVEHLLLH